PEDLLEGGGDEIRVARGLRREPPRQQASLIVDEPAVRQRQRLLRNDALFSLVTLLRVRSVKELEELDLRLRGMAEVDAAAIDLLVPPFLQLWPAGREIELTGDLKDAVAHRLGLHPARVHAPEVLVLRVDPNARVARISGARLHPVGVARDDQAVHRLCA